MVQNKSPLGLNSWRLKKEAKTELGDLLPTYLTQQLEVTVAAARENLAIMALFKSQGEGSMKEVKDQNDTVKKDKTKHLEQCKF